MVAAPEMIQGQPIQAIDGKFYEMRFTINAKKYQNGF